MSNRLSRNTTISLLILWGLTLIACNGAGNKNKNEGKDGQAKGKEGNQPQHAKIGDEVSFNDSTWVVLSAEDKGNTIQSNNQFQKDAETTGKFVLVHFKVTNLSKKEQRIINIPKVIDSDGREFKHHDKQTFYIPKGSETMTNKALPASLPKEFYGVYEVPADAKGLRFQTRDLSSVISPDYKLVELGF
jgi:hypothetical protein